jgi:hypothetical protein
MMKLQPSVRSNRNPYNNPDINAASQQVTTALRVLIPAADANSDLQLRNSEPTIAAPAA